MFAKIILQETAESEETKGGDCGGKMKQAVDLPTLLVTQDEFNEFLTLPAYEQLD